VFYAFILQLRGMHYENVNIKIS